MLHTILNLEPEKIISAPRVNKELNSQHQQQCCGTDRSKKERGLNSVQPRGNNPAARNLSE